MAYPPCVPEGEVDLAALMPSGANRYVEVEQVEALLRFVGLEVETMLPGAGAQMDGIDRLAVATYLGKTGGLLVTTTQDYWVDREAVQQLLASAGPRPGGGLQVPLGAPSRGEGAERLVVWYPSRCVLAAGDESFVDGVDRLVTGAGPALGQDATFQRLRRSFDRSALANGIVGWSQDGDQPSAASSASGGTPLVEATPTVMPLRASPRAVVGFRTTLSGGSLPGPEIFAPSTPLTLAARLPSSAVAWLACSSAFGLAGSELANQLAPWMTGEQLALLKEHSGLDLPSLLAALGDQGVLAILAPAAPAPRSSIRALIDRGALVFVQELATDWESQGIVKAAIAHGASHSDLAGVELTDHGFVAPLPARKGTLQGKVYIADARGDHLWVSIGEPGLSKRGLRAFRRGTHTLAAAGRRGMGKPLPARRMALWVDPQWAEPLIEELGAHGRQIGSGDRLSWLDLSVRDQGYELTSELDLATVEIAALLFVEYAMAGFFESLGEAVARDLGKLLGWAEQDADGDGDGTVTPLRPRPASGLLRPERPEHQIPQG